MKMSLNMTIYLCYYLRINDKEYRNELSQALSKIFKSEISHNGNFIVFPETEIENLTKKMEIDEGIALNRALRENLYTCYTCIEANIPLIIVGKPGTGKSLSFNILYNTLKGENSKNVFFRDKGKLYRHYYQGSETSTSDGIKKVFQKARTDKNNNKNKQTITLVFFDEMGLAERSSNNPLKIMHYLLERDSENSVPFLGISNWRLDAAKINRALNLSITDYDEKDLKDTAVYIAEALDLNLTTTYRDFFETLAMTYKNYIEKSKNENIKENKDFHGNRDFYTLIKTAMRELMERKEEINNNESKVLTEVGILSLNRNFGGLENSSLKINEIFKELYGHKYDETIDFSKGFSVLNAIRKNLLDSNSRYLMLISEGNDASDIVKYVLNSLNKNYIELVGSKYKNDIKSGQYSEEILNKIKYIMEAPNILILKDLDVVYPSLYDLFNQNFTNCGDKKFARIAFEYAKVSSQVNKDFHAVVIVNKRQIEQMKLDPPFLNRFEKHIINFNMLLTEKDLEIGNKIYNFIKLISSFDNNEELTINLDKLLVNCERHNIEGLIFKIKNDMLKNKKEGEIQNLQGPEYEDFIIKESFKKIAPTFCQDIIASMKYSNLYLKDNNLYQIILNYYQEANKINFEDFFKNVKLKRNIIFTFSKVTENLIDNNKEIKNEFGVFNSQSTITEMIETIQCENDLIFLLKAFANSQSKNLLSLKFTEKDLNKINSINYVIKNYEKENPKIKEKLILFIIHKQRTKRKEENIIVKSDLIPFINEDYYQLFIDNLQGQKNSILEIINNKDETTLAKEYINNSEFLDKKLYIVLNYFKYNILFETENLNRKNFTIKCADKILTNKKLKDLFLNNLQKQGQAIQGVIKDIFTKDSFEVNDIDFFEIINSKLSIFFCEYLLNILNYSFEKEILCQLLNNDNIDLILDTDSFNNSINEVFDTIKFKKKLKKNINANSIKIYNGLKLPGCRIDLNKIVNYFYSEIAGRFEKSEGSLRKNYKTGKKVDEVVKKYEEKVKLFEQNIKTEINKHHIFKELFNQNNEEFKKSIINDYLINFIIKNFEVQNTDYIINTKLLSFLKLIIKMKLSVNNNYEYEFQNTLDEFAKIIIFIQGYKEEIKNFFDIFMEANKYCQDIEDRIITVMKEQNIKDEESERNQKHSKIVNLNFFYIIESFIKSILSYSVELIKEDTAKFYDYFYSFPLLEAIFQKVNHHLSLYSKEIYNMRSIIKIEEALIHNHEQFEKNYEKIMNILFQESFLFYDGKYEELYNNIIELIKFLDGIFLEKNEEYINLLFFIFREKKPKETLLSNFMNLGITKFKRFRKLFEILKKIDSLEFNEILLYFFEEQCQTYSLKILNNNGNQYSQKCCKELLLGLSFDYLKKAIEYLYENKNKNDNNILKFYAIGYLKTYCYFYVYINFKEFDKCNFEEINKLLYANDEENQLMIKVRNIYIWRVYCKHFQNFEQFKNYQFKELPNIKDLNNLLSKGDENMKYIFKENLITPKSSPNYAKMASELENINEINFEKVNDNFDLFYCSLINKVISYTYGDENDIKNSKEKMNQIYNASKDKIKFNDEGKKIYEILLNDKLFENEVMKKISDDKPITLEDFEILLY